jgi:CubicO group peptidase (beta-lactamase class C family)
MRCFFNKFRINICLFTILSIFLFSLENLHAEQEDFLPTLESYIEQVRQDWKVPGVAIAIVKDDQVVFAKGYGLTKLGDSKPVTEKTVFAIASCTKAFTSAALALLTEEKYLHWDSRVVDYLDDFQLFDSTVTEQLTIRDLLSHRTGLKRADLVWYGTKHDRQEVIHRLRYIKPSWDFRTRYGYQNIMFLAAGEIIPKLIGESWDNFIRERFFIPLGMATTTTSVNDLRDFEDIAMPHIKVQGEVKPISWRNIDNVGPAASINSNVLEMAQWIRLHLGKGVYEQQQLISSHVLEEMYQAQISIPLNSKSKFDYPGASYLAYGLGWFLHDYHGYQVVEHGGAIDGMSALVAMIPEKQLGIVILTNMEHSRLPRVLEYEIFDRYLDQPNYDWSSYFLNEHTQKQSHSQFVQSGVDNNMVVEMSPSIPLENYIGIYHDDLYGDAEVSLENGKLVIDFLAFQGELHQWQFNTFKFDPSQTVPTQLSKWTISFCVNDDGLVNELKISELEETTFKKKFS